MPDFRPAGAVGQPYGVFRKMDRRLAIPTRRIVRADFAAWPGLAAGRRNSGDQWRAFAFREFKFAGVIVEEGQQGG